MTGPETEFRNWQHVPQLPVDALDAFTEGYLEAVAFTDMSDEGDEAFGCEFAPEAIEAAARDCQRFQTANAAMLEAAYHGDYDAHQAGRDFWFTRNGHGVGYWDRKQLTEAVGEALSEAARRWSQRDTYEVDGLAHFM